MADCELPRSGISQLDRPGTKSKIGLTSSQLIWKKTFMIVGSKKISFGELAHSKWVSLKKISKVPKKNALRKPVSKNFV